MSVRTNILIRYTRHIHPYEFIYRYGIIIQVAIQQILRTYICIHSQRKNSTFFVLNSMKLKFVKIASPHRAAINLEKITNRNQATIDLKKKHWKQLSSSH